MKVITMPDDPVVLAYAAGLLDGEGTIHIVMGKGTGKVAKYHVLEVCISSVDSVLTDWLHIHFGGLLYMTKQKNPNARDLNRWTLRHHGAELFLKSVRPYLLLKGDRADIALEYRKTVFSNSDPRSNRRLSEKVLETREGLRSELRELNRRGKEIESFV